MPNEADTPKEPSPRPRRFRRLLRKVLLVGMVLFVVGAILIELVGRFRYGLCDPPLFVADPELEYILKPNQSCRQFGNRVEVNEYSMRSHPFPRAKSSPNEFRVMVLGDSVIYGGSRVDQDDLATSRLERMLAASMKRPVTVGNISAGSWGPPNLLVYAKRNGFFDADVIVIVVSQQDYDDAMTFAPVVGVDSSYPDHKPRLALWEIATRYLPRYIAIKRQSVTGETGITAAAEVKPENIAASMNALAELIRMAKQSGARVIVAQHWMYLEVTGKRYDEQAVIEKTATDAGAEVIQLGPGFRAAIDAGENPYRDYIHPSPVGQRVIAEKLAEAINLSKPAASAPSPASPPR